MPPINFKANYIKPTLIQKDNKDYRVSLVELDSANIKDINAIRNIAYDWGIKTFAYDIYNCLKYQRYYSDSLDTSPQKYYAITNQKFDYANLNASEVLGLAKVTFNDDFNEIDYLITEPTNSYSSPNRLYKGIGRALIKDIKSISNQKPIILYTTTSAIDFYKEQGFKHEKDKDADNKMVWAG